MSRIVITMREKAEVPITSRDVNRILLPAVVALLSLTVLSYAVGPVSSYSAPKSVCMPGFYEHIYCRAVTASSSVSSHNHIVIAVSVIGLIGSLAYYIASPEVKIPLARPRDAEIELYKVLLRFLKEDEKKVVELLRSSGGELLQKDIGKQTGLSKIKTHRIIVKLAGRGVLAVERHRKANRVKLLIP